MKYFLLINLKLITTENFFLAKKIEHEHFSANKHDNAKCWSYFSQRIWLSNVIDAVEDLRFTGISGLLRRRTVWSRRRCRPFDDGR